MFIKFSRILRKHHQNEQALTLIELLIVIALVAIVAGIALPILLNVLFNAKTSSAADSANNVQDFVQQWSSAGYDVTYVDPSDPTFGGVYGGGLVAFMDNNNNGTLDSGEPIIAKVVGGSPADDTLAGTDSDGHVGGGSSSGGSVGPVGPSGSPGASYVYGLGTSDPTTPTSPVVALHGGWVSPLTTISYSPFATPGDVQDPVAQQLTEPYFSGGDWRLGLYVQTFFDPSSLPTRNDEGRTTVGEVGNGSDYNNYSMTCAATQWSLPSADWSLGLGDTDTTVDSTSIVSLDLWSAAACPFLVSITPDVEEYTIGGAVVEHSQTWTAELFATTPDVYTTRNFPEYTLCSDAAQDNASIGGSTCAAALAGPSH